MKIHYLNTIGRGMSLLFSLLFSLSSWAEKVEIDGIFYNLKVDGSAEVTFRGDDEDGWMYFSPEDLYVGDLIVPSQISYGEKSYLVSAIGADAFAGSRYLQSLVLPSSLKTIGSGAFTLCNGLESINAEDNPVFVSQNGVLYQRSPLSIFFVPRNISGDITLLDGIIEIPSGAFQNCVNLTTISLPSDVTTISDGAFNNCANLQEIFMGDKVETIGEYAFSKCSSLSIVSFPESVRSIKAAAFADCSNLAYPLFHEGLEYIGKMAFYNCQTIMGVQLPSTLTFIGEQAFKECVSLDVVKNDSKLLVTLGSTDYGYVAYYASEIIQGAPSASLNVISDKRASFSYADGHWTVYNASGKWISIYSYAGQFLGRFFCHNKVEKIPFATSRVIVVAEY
ncbi:MAG: leucine-rich repeat domain-containing protein [Bacteroidales bacterium]|nr:leucine-rich repeat domain-containing protein [Candidatus Physcocola equi]